MELSKQLEILDQQCPLEKGYKCSKRVVRHNFFNNICTEIQAYLLGFFVADGHCDEERHAVDIHVTETDQEIPLLFRKIVTPDSKVYKSNGWTQMGVSKQINVKPNVRVTAYSKRLFESLCQMGYTGRKTYKNLCLPKLNDELMWHFIRGYFDGDGCIIGSARKPNPKNREINWRWCMHVDFVAKNRALLDEIVLFLQKYNITAKVNYLKVYDAYRLVICRKTDVCNFFHKLYDTAEVKLERKFTKFEHYVNTEVTQLIAEHRNA